MPTRIWETSRNRRRSPNLISQGIFQDDGLAVEARYYVALTFEGLAPLTNCLLFFFSFFLSILSPVLLVVVVVPVVVCCACRCLSLSV